MCSEFKYLETLEFNNQITGEFRCEYSEDGHIFIITHCGIHILQLCMKPEVVAPSICFKKFYIPTDRYIFSTNLGIDPNNFARELSRLEFYELSLMVDVSPRLYLFNEMDSKICMARWSPAYLDGSSSLLGILTDMGSLQIYARTFTHVIHEEYASICNISSHIINMCKMKWSNTRNMSPSCLFNELKLRVQMKPTAFAWSRLFKSDDGNYALMVVGHLKEIITIWKVSVMDQISKEGCVRCMLKIKTNLSHITALHFYNTADRGLILAGDYDGNALGIPLMYITDSEIKVGDHMVFTKYDQVQVSHAEILLHNGFMYLIYVKGDALLIYLVNNRGRLLDCCVFEVGSLDIVGLNKIDDNVLLVQTITGLTKEIKLECVQSKIRIGWRHIYINVNWSTKRSHGMIFSTNKVLSGILTYPCKLNIKKEDKSLINLVLFHNMAVDPLKLIINNEKSMLCKLWDCFEVLRVSALMEKQLPCINLPKTKHYSEVSLGKFKVYMHISKICGITYDLQETLGDIGNIESYNTLKYVFNVSLILYRICYLLKLQREDNITEFQMQNLFILNNYMKESILLDGSVNLMEHFGMYKKINDVIIACNELEYPPMPKCLICDDRLIDFSCIPRHFEQRCVITLMPLDPNKSYKCPFCKCRAHAKLKEEVDLLLCPYCDIGMDYFVTEVNVKEINSLKL